VYVIGRSSNNVVVFSPDGQRHRQLLSFKDGLIQPTVLDYDKAADIGGVDDHQCLHFSRLVKYLVLINLYNTHYKYHSKKNILQA
jgi:hypothetical protein